MQSGYLQALTAAVQAPTEPMWLSRSELDLALLCLWMQVDARYCAASPLRLCASRGVHFSTETQFFKRRDPSLHMSRTNTFEPGPHSHPTTGKHSDKEQLWTGCKLNGKDPAMAQGGAVTARVLEASLSLDCLHATGMLVSTRSGAADHAQCFGRTISTFACILSARSVLCSRKLPWHDKWLR